MKAFYRVLIAVVTGVDAQLSVHKKIAKAIHKSSDVHGSSAVYLYTDDNEEGLVVAYSLRTQMEPKEFKNKISDLTAPIRGGFSEVKILAFEDIILRGPEFALPFEELHQFKKWCLPASDLWGDYVHPVENLELKQLLEEIKTNEKLEFFAQSKSLLDFLRIET